MNYDTGYGSSHDLGGGGGPPSKRSRGPFNNSYNNYNNSSNSNRMRRGGSSGPAMSESQMLDRFLERQDAKIAPNTIVLISVLHPTYPINAEVIHKVTSLVGTVKRIVCFEKNNWLQAMVEFDTLETATKARDSLHGCDIYNDCCTMKVEFSKMQPPLQVRENGPMSWDFESGSGGMFGGSGGTKRKSILNRPDGAPSGGGGMPGAGGGNSFGGFGAHTQSGGGAPFGGGAGSAAPFGGGSGPFGGGMMTSTGNSGRSPLTGQALATGGYGGGSNQGGESGLPPLLNSMMNAAANNMYGSHALTGCDTGLDGGMRGGYNDGSCVLLVYGLEPPHWNCSRLFNLICQYGNVRQMFFIRNKPNTAMVEMGSPDHAENVVGHLRGDSPLQVFGETVKFEISKKHRRINNLPPEWELADGQPSRANYAHERDTMNRFLQPEQAAKNRLIRPSKVLHFFGIPRVSEDELTGVFRDAGAPEPHQIKFVSPKIDAAAKKAAGVGLAYFDSVDQATEALVLANHAKVENKSIKLCYSPAKY